MNFTFENHYIDQISQMVEDFLTNLGTKDKEILRIRYIIEEILLRWQSFFGNEKQAELILGKRLMKPIIKISVKGEMFDPIAESEEPDSVYLRNALANAGQIPEYSYTKKVNTIVFYPQKKKLSPIIKIATALLLAIITGLLFTLLPPEFAEIVNKNILSPFTSMFLGVLSAIAGPMIFVSVIWGIYSIGDISTFNIIGKKLITNILFRIVVFTFFSFCAVILLLGININLTGVANSDFSEIINLILEIVPNNIVAPFVNGNTLQIMFLAVVIGIVLLILDKKALVITNFVEQCNFIINIVMKGIVSFLYIYVFFSILQLIINNSATSLSEGGKIILLDFSLCIIIMLISIMLVVIKKRISFILLIKKIFPTFIIAFSTASSSAAFTTNIDSCEKLFGIDKKLTRFGVPLCQLLYKPTPATLFLVAALFMANQYQLQISLSWIITAFVIVVMTAFSMPPIPGGAIACYTILFSQLGIPAEALAVVIAVEIIFDFFATAAAIVCSQTALIWNADKLNLLDDTILKKPMKQNK